MLAVIPVQLPLRDLANGGNLQPVICHGGTSWQDTVKNKLRRTCMGLVTTERIGTRGKMIAVVICLCSLNSCALLLQPREDELGH